MQALLLTVLRRLLWHTAAKQMMGIITHTFTTIDTVPIADTVTGTMMRYKHQQCSRIYSMVCCYRLCAFAVASCCVASCSFMLQRAADVGWRSVHNQMISTITDALTGTAI